MKNTPPTNTTEPTPSCAGKISQESVRLNRKTTQDATTLEILQADQSIDDIPAWKGKAQFDEEAAAANTGLNKNWFKRL